MKQLLVRYSKYDLWANQQILTLVLGLAEIQQEQEIISSFSSIHKTCSHIWDAYRIWWQRLQNETGIMGPTVNTGHPLKDVVDQILLLNQKWIDWVNNASASDLLADFNYTNMKGEVFCQPMSEIILHLGNHGTYHRGQLVTMLRQAGVEKVPQTDYIVFSRIH